MGYALVCRYPQDLRGAMILDTTIPGLLGWDESMSGPAAWHVGFMQIPGLAEELATGRHAAYLRYFFGFSRFTPAEQEHYLKTYGTPANSTLRSVSRSAEAVRRGPGKGTGKRPISESGDSLKN